MNVIPEMRRSYQFRYLRFYYITGTHHVSAVILAIGGNETLLMP